MIYKVKAKYNKETAKEFFQKLSDGTIHDQHPDGAEIVSSMKRAKITAPGIIEWYEMCFCPTPLQHEKATVYNFYVSDLTTARVDDYDKVEGESFWLYLNSLI